jgi:hypothetical protein
LQNQIVKDALGYLTPAAVHFAGTDGKDRETFERQKRQSQSLRRVTLVFEEVSHVAHAVDLWWSAHLSVRCGCADARLPRFDGLDDFRQPPR